MKPVNNGRHDPAKRWAFFDIFRLDLENNDVYRGKRRVKLPEQAVRVLKMMVLTHGEVVSRDAICAEIWDNRLVDFEAGLNTAILQIRRALGDDASDARFVETIPRRGYRFIQTPRFSATADVSRLSPGKMWALAAAGIAVVIGIFVILFNQSSSSALPTATSDRFAELRSPGYKNHVAGTLALSERRFADAEAELRLAIEADPELASARVALARTLVNRRSAGWQNLVEARELVDQAIALDPALPEAHILNAGISLYYFRDQDDALKSIQTAEKLAPGAVGTFVVKGYLFTIQGNYDEALESIAMAYEVAPLSASLNANYGWMHYKARNWDDAERLCRTSAELDPASQFALSCIIHVKHSKGDFAEAAEYGLELMHLRGASDQEIASIRQIPDARTREQAFWSWNVQWLEDPASKVTDALSKRGIALTMLGRQDEAIEVLNLALDRNGEAFLAFVAVDPRLDELRDHPQFERLAQRSLQPVPGVTKRTSG